MPQGESEHVPLGTWSAWAPFAVCVVLTTVATLAVGYADRQAERARFRAAVIAARDRIEARMASYGALLRGVAGLLSRPQPTSPADFRLSVEQLRLPQDYPGTLGIGYTQRFGDVTPAQATAQAHSAGWTDVRVWPATARDDVHAIVLIAPLDARNRAALGYDMHTEPTRRAAMDRARDRGDTSLSGKVTLVQEIAPNKQAGFLLYLPIYDGGIIPATIAERRERLKGFAYAPLRAGDLFEGVFGREPPPLAFALYDGERAEPASLLYSAGRSIGARDEVLVERIALAGRVWTARFARARPPQAPLGLLVAGLGGLLSVFVLGSSLTREQARARELRATAAEIASREMVRFHEMFVGVLGHDLRNPLNAIKLTTQTLLRRLGDDETTKQSLERIIASSNRMSRMISQVLDMTRVRLGGGIPTTPQPCDLGSIARDVVDEVTRARPESRVLLDVAGDVRGTWDADRLAQVLSNLVGNAAQHDAGQPVRVSLSGTERDHVVVRVANAAAVPAPLLPTLFEPFRRGDAGERTAPGLGLGLFISRSIVQAHAGSIDVRSDEAAGTTFTVRLPRQPGGAVASA